MQEIFNAIGTLDLNLGVWKLFLRVFLALIAGFILGLESRSRAKDAGVKTHTFICITSCVLMIISKYGFYELAKFEGIQYDASRVASTIISGLCFVGAGMVFYKRDTIKGLTTSVGMCLTIAIGMCFGSGLLITGAFVTFVTLLLQLFMHLKISIFKNKKLVIVKAQFITDNEYIETFKQIFNVKHFKSFKIIRQEDKCVAEIEFYYRNTLTSEEIAKKIEAEPQIIMFEKIEEK